ncbi:MAG TPA: DUF192 domain-containing protein [Candidatus Saccharimonadales bacterium]|nr:DUF192 domain-containing protein [Candidatus Saccharimonadales bacterium]
MKTVFIIIGVLAVLLIGVALLKYFPSSGFFALFPNSPLNVKTEGTATIKNHTFKLFVAKTTQEQHQGLSDRDSLPEDTGMLFIFNTPDYYQFWMRHMKFPLDIIYINNNKIVTVLENVKNPAYSIENPPILRPNAPADNVLEINAGLSKKYDIKIGDTIDIKISKN